METGNPLKNREKTKINVADAGAEVDAARKARAAHDPGDVAKYAQRVRAHWKQEQGQKVWSVGIELKSSANPCGLCGKPMPKRRKNPVCGDCVEKLKERREEMKGEMTNVESD